MSDPVANLRAELVAAARRQAAASTSAHPRTKGRAWRGRHLTAIAALLIFSGSAAAAAVKLTEERSAPLSGTLPRLPRSGGKPSSSGQQYRFTMLPDLQAGHTGWCYDMVLTTSAGPAGGGGCAPAPVAGRHLIGGGSMIVSGNRILEYALVDSHVASVRFNGKRVHTIVSTGLPSGWRAAVTVIGLPTPHRRLHGELSALLSAEWTAFNRQGRPFPRPRHTEGSVNTPTRAVSSTHPPAGRCSIHQAQAISGLKSIAAEAIRGKPRHQPPLDGQAFTSCAETTFTLHGNTLTASVLVNASHPTRRASALPSASAKPGEPGVVEISTGMRQLPPTHLLGGHTLIEGGPITARRDGTAWLAVQGGTAQQRHAILSAFEAG